MIGPRSTEASVKWIVHPVTLTPAARASLWAWAPGKAGSREGWMFMIRMGNWPMKYVVTSRMNPAKTTRSVRFSFRTFTTSRSKAARSFPKGRWSITTAGTSCLLRPREDRRSRHVADEDDEVRGEVPAVARVHETL